MYDEDMKIYIPTKGSKPPEVSNSTEVRVYQPSQHQGTRNNNRKTQSEKDR